MNHSVAYLRWLGLLACFLLASGLENSTFAGNLPLLKYAARSGNVVVWNVQVDPYCPYGNAYYSLRFQANLPTGVTASDRTLRIELYSNSFNGREYDEHVTYYLNVPEGSAGITESLEFPQRQYMNSIFIQLYEDGEKLLEQRVAINLAGSGRPDLMDDISNIVVIDKDMVTSAVRDTWRNRYLQKDSPFAEKHNLPDVRAFYAIQPDLTGLMLSSVASGDPKNGFRLDDAGLLTFSDLSQGLVNYVTPQELGSRWLALSNADYIFISRADLLDLKKNQEPQFEALAHWCLAGGILIIYDAGKENAPQAIDSLLNLASPNATTIDHQWQEPRAEDFKLDVNAGNNNGRNNNLNYWLNLTAEDFPITDFDKYTDIQLNQIPSLPAAAVEGVQNNVRMSRGRRKVPVPTELPFQFRRYGFGHLVAWKETEEEAFPGKIEYWNWLQHSIQADKRMWSKRHGMSHRSENNDYWNFLIPGIGQAPVFMFMGVIGLFMVLIGPTNFHLLKRFKRVSLLLVTVPLGAILFTLGLVFFAVFSDGFASQARLRSFTRLEDGRAVAMSRQMLFAAFVPSSGLKFPSDTAVYPLHHRPWEMATGYGQHYFQSESERNEGEITLRSRYLGSREQRQFVVVRATECTARLDVQEIPQPAVNDKPQPSKIRVTNRLGVPLELALIRGSQREFYLAENLAADTGVELSPLSDADLMQSIKPGQPPTKILRWQQLLNNDSLNFPTDFSTNQYSMLSRNNYYYQYGNRNQGTAMQSESMLEQGRLQALQATQPANPPRYGKPTERQYFVITATSLMGSDGKPLVPVGLPSAEIVRQSHVLHGNW